MFFHSTNVQRLDGDVPGQAVNRRMEFESTRTLSNLFVAKGAGRLPIGQPLTNEMRRIAPKLRMHGLSINFEKTREGRRVTLTTAHVPINQASHVTSSPIKISVEQRGSDYPGATRNSNA